MSDEKDLGPIDWLCPNCGWLMYDMRGKGFNIHQAAQAGRCVYIGNGDYTCAEEQKKRDSRALGELRKP